MKQTLRVYLQQSDLEVAMVGVVEIKTNKQI